MTTNILLKNNKKLELEIPEFLCDDILNKKLLKYEMLNHLNKYTFNICVGRPGSGKTSFVVSLLKGKNEKQIYRKIFNNIF